MDELDELEDSLLDDELKAKLELDINDAEEVITEGLVPPPLPPQAVSNNARGTPKKGLFIRINCLYYD